LRRELELRCVARFHAQKHTAMFLCAHIVAFHIKVQSFMIEVQPAREWECEEN
jgi:hypothetical protein